MIFVKHFFLLNLNVVYLERIKNTKCSCFQQGSLEFGNFKNNFSENYDTTWVLAFRFGQPYYIFNWPVKFKRDIEIMHSVFPELMHACPRPT